MIDRISTLDHGGRFKADPTGVSDPFVNGNAEMHGAPGERKWMMELVDLWKKRWWSIYTTAQSAAFSADTDETFHVSSCLAALV